MCVHMEVVHNGGGTSGRYILCRVYCNEVELLIIWSDGT